MDKNKELEKEINELSNLLHSRNCTGYFICCTFDDAAGLARYNSESYLELLGYVELIKADLSLQMLDALDQNKLNIEKKQDINDFKNKMN